MSEIERGFNSPLWMAKAVVCTANAELLRIAVCDVMDFLWSEEEVDAEDVFDRIVQVATTGRYSEVNFSQDEYEDMVKFADEVIENDIENQVAKFRQQLDNMPGGEDGDVE